MQPDLATLPFAASAGTVDGWDYVAILIRTIFVLVCIALLVGAALVFRKRYMADDTLDVAGGFSMGGLRDLVRQGKMTQTEFEAAKAKIVEANHRRTAEAAAAAKKAAPPRLPDEVERIDGQD